MKKFGLSLLAIGGSLVSFAEETGGTSSDVTADVVEAAETAIQGLATTVGPTLVTIIGAGLAIWGAIALVGVIKRAFSAGKGR